MFNIFFLFPDYDLKLQRLGFGEWSNIKLASDLDLSPTKHVHYFKLANSTWWQSYFTLVPSLENLWICHTYFQSFESFRTVFSVLVPCYMQHYIVYIALVFFNAIKSFSSLRMVLFSTKKENVFKSP